MRSAILLCCLLVEAPDRRRLAAYNYMQVAKLTAADAAAGDFFGGSVAIDGNTIVVGAYRKNSYTGAAYVFRTTDGGATYGQVAKLTAADGATWDYFGSSVAIDGDTVVVGAWSAGTGGAAYIFRTTDGGATYGQVAKLTADDAATGDFGRSVAIDGATIVVGSPYDDDGGSYSGSAYVFRTDDGGATYVEVAKLTASDAAAGDRFGVSVAIDGDTIVVGAYGDDDGYASGSAYVFRTSDGGATYGQVAKLTASDAAREDYFGTSVAIDGATIVVGAYGGEAAYVFRTSDGGATYVEVAKLTAADASSYDYFGVSVAIDGDTIVVGAYAGGGISSGWGSAYVFLTTDGGATYARVAKLTASDAAASDNFGVFVAIDGDTVVVGSRYDDDAGTNSGSAYVFDANAPTSQPTTSRPTTSQPTSHPTPRPSPQPTAQPTAQPTKQVDALAPWEIALILIAGLIFFGVACFVCIRRLRKSRPSAKTSPVATETPPMLRTTSVLPMGTVESVQAPDADAAPPILGEVVTHSTVLSVSN